MNPHPYAEDVELPADHRGERPCRPPCGLPRTNRVHDLPPAPPAQVEHRRRIGDED